MLTRANCHGACPSIEERARKTSYKRIRHFARRQACRKIEIVPVSQAGEPRSDMAIWAVGKKYFSLWLWSFAAIFSRQDAKRKRRQNIREHRCFSMVCLTGYERRFRSLRRRGGRSICSSHFNASSNRSNLRSSARNSRL